MFVRKLYYDIDSGVTLGSYMREGDVIITSFAEDSEVLPSLNGRTEADTGCMIWTEPDETLEKAFATATGVSVDVTVEPHQPVFDYTPIEDELIEPDPATMEAALNELGVVTRES